MCVSFLARFLFVCFWGRPVHGGPVSCRQATDILSGRFPGSSLGQSGVKGLVTALSFGTGETVGQAGGLVGTARGARQATMDEPS